MTKRVMQLQAGSGSSVCLETHHATPAENYNFPAPAISTFLQLLSKKERILQNVW